MAPPWTQGKTTTVLRASFQLASMRSTLRRPSRTYQGLWYAAWVKQLEPRHTTVASPAALGTELERTTGKETWGGVPRLLEEDTVFLPVGHAPWV